MKSFSAKLGQLIVPSSFVVMVYLLTCCEGEKDRKHGRSKRCDVFDCLHILSIGPFRTYVKFKGFHISLFFRVTLESPAFFGRMMDHLRSEMSTFRHLVLLSSRGYHGNHRKTVAKKL